MNKAGIVGHGGQVKNVSVEEKHTSTSHGTVGTDGGKGAEFKTQDGSNGNGVGGVMKGGGTDS